MEDTKERKDKTTKHNNSNSKQKENDIKKAVTKEKHDDNKKVVTKEKHDDNKKVIEKEKHDDNNKLVTKEKHDDNKKVVTKEKHDDNKISVTKKKHDDNSRVSVTKEKHDDNKKVVTKEKHDDKIQGIKEKHDDKIRQTKEEHDERKTKKEEQLLPVNLTNTKQTSEKDIRKQVMKNDFSDCKDLDTHEEKNDITTKNKDKKHKKDINESSKIEITKKENDNKKTKNYFKNIFSKSNDESVKNDCDNVKKQESIGETENKNEKTSNNKNYKNVPDKLDTDNDPQNNANNDSNSDDSGIESDDYNDTKVENYNTSKINSQENTNRTNSTNSNNKMKHDDTEHKHNSDNDTRKNRDKIDDNGPENNDSSDSNNDDTEHKHNSDNDTRKNTDKIDDNGPENNDSSDSNNDDNYEKQEQEIVQSDDDSGFEDDDEINDNSNTDETENQESETNFEIEKNTIRTKKEQRDFTKKCINKINVNIGGKNLKNTTSKNDFVLANNLTKLIENRNLDMESNLIGTIHQLHRIYEAIYRADTEKLDDLNRFSDEELELLHQYSLDDVYKIPINHNPLFYAKRNIKLINLEESKAKKQIISENTTLSQFNYINNKTFYALAERLKLNDSYTPVFFINNQIANEVNYTEKTFDFNSIPNTLNMYFSAQIYFMARYLSNTNTAYNRQSYYNVKTGDLKGSKIFAIYNKEKLNNKHIKVIKKYMCLANLDLKTREKKQLLMIYCFNPLCHCTNHESKILSPECLTKILMVLLFHNNNKKFTIRYKLIYSLHKLPAMASFLYLVKQKYEYYQKNPLKSRNFRKKITYRCEDTTYISIKYVTEFCADLERYLYVLQNIQHGERKENKENKIDNAYFTKLCNENIIKLQSILYARMIQLISSMYLSKSMNNFKSEMDAKIEMMNRLDIDTLVLQNYKHFEVLLHQIFSFVPFFGVFNEYELLLESDLTLKFVKYYDNNTKLVVAKGFVQDLMHNKIFLKYYAERFIKPMILFLYDSCCFTFEDAKQYIQYQRHWCGVINLYETNNCGEFLLI